MTPGEFLLWAATVALGLVVLSIGATLAVGIFRAIFTSKARDRSKQDRAPRAAGGKRDIWDDLPKPPEN